MTNANCEVVKKKTNNDKTIRSRFILLVFSLWHQNLSCALDKIFHFFATLSLSVILE